MYVSHMRGMIISSRWLKLLITTLKDTKIFSLWIDLFSGNQHAEMELSSIWWGSGSSSHHQRGSIKSAVQHCKHTVVVVSNWQDPKPFDRTWCLVEIYFSALVASKFEITMNRDRLGSFKRLFGSNPGERDWMLSKINRQSSMCFSPTDKDCVCKMIDATVGMQSFNKLVIATTTKWVLSLFDIAEEVQQEANPSETDKILAEQSSFPEDLAITANQQEAVKRLDSVIIGADDGAVVGDGVVDGGDYGDYDGGGGDGGISGGVIKRSGTNHHHNFNYSGNGVISMSDTVLVGYIAAVRSLCQEGLFSAAVEHLERKALFQHRFLS